MIICIMKSVIIVGLQWGDEGKGKFVDYLAEDFDAVVRFNGGSNAGHTVMVNGKKVVFHLLPSGALWGKRLFIGPGVTVNPEQLAEETALFPGVRLGIDLRATVLTPFEVWLDRKMEEMRGKSAIGTTGRGIGPSYADRMFRLSLRVCDLVSGRLPDYGPLAAAFGYREDLTAWAERARGAIEGFVADVPSELMGVYEKDGSLLFESAQGSLLDIIYGTYPYVTSSNTLASYVSVGAGFPFSMVDSVRGVSKAYQTRVGAGPFPTELEGELADRIRGKGKEYGSTTGRPRRVGWLDLVSLKYSVKLNRADSIMLTKLDVLSGLGKLRVATGYSVDGKSTDDFTTVFTEDVMPEYIDLDPIPDVDWAQHARDGRLPVQAMKLVEFIEDQLRVKVSMVSVGQERGMTVEL